MAPAVTSLRSWKEVMARSARCVALWKASSALTFSAKRAFLSSSLNVRGFQAFRLRSSSMSTSLCTFLAQQASRSTKASLIGALWKRACCTSWIISSNWLSAPLSPTAKEPSCSARRAPSLKAPRPPPSPTAPDNSCRGRWAAASCLEASKSAPPTASNAESIPSYSESSARLALRGSSAKSGALPAAGATTGPPLRNDGSDALFAMALTNDTIARWGGLATTVTQRCAA
mmetsp:Transcript_122472/g.261324  ORF Transcript_122472/g.261324 Transcript_122472/m.261324 type:complete len:230 (-) Transcript_122472:3-692(-)